VGHLDEHVVVDLVDPCAHLVDGRRQLRQPNRTHLKINFLDGEGVGAHHLLAVGVVVIGDLQLGLLAALLDVDLVPTHIQVALQAPVHLPWIQLPMLQALYVGRRLLV